MADRSAGPVVLVAVLSLSAAHAAADASPVLDRAKAMMARGEYQQVVTLLTPAASNPSAAPRERAERLVTLGSALVALGDVEQAEHAADGAERGANASAETRFAVEMIRGRVAETSGDEVPHYLRAVEWADRSGHSSLVRLAVEQASEAYLQKGLADRALALVNARLNGSAADPNRAMYLVLRGAALREMRDIAGARAALDEALPLAERSANPEDLAAIHRSRGLLIWRFERDRPRALREFDEGLAFATQAGSRGQVVGLLNSIGNVLRGSAAQDRATLGLALRRYEEALAIARQASGPGDTAMILKNIGDVHRLLGDAERAERALTEAIGMADRSDTTQIRWMARMYVGMLVRDRDPARAERLFGESVAILEADANQMALGDQHAGFVAAGITISDNPYEQFVDFLLATNRPDRAFDVAERQRARVLLDALAAGGDAVTREAPAAFSSAERDLLARIKMSQAALRTVMLTDAKRQELVARVERSETELNDLRLRLAVDRPALARARYPKLLTIGDVRSGLLNADEALVTFYLEAKQSVAWVATSDRLESIRLPSRKAIETAVRAALKELRDPAGAAQPALSALSRTLAIDEIAKRAARQRLVIVPDGILFDVPFEAMLDEAARPLVERFAVSYAPSASALAVLRTAPTRSAPALTLIAVANPVVNPSPRNSTRQIELKNVNLLGPVPYSGQEARRIARLFGNQALVLEGAQANTAALGAAGIAHARMLHFATHGLIDEERPERSGLVLTANPPQDDGLLQTRDIYGLRLDADLVTLSACETALGQNVTGEGMIGLTRAFFYAGARSVVASLWDVEDASTARLMEAFYRNIRRGQPIDIALQQAKLTFVRSGGDSSRPFTWASFIVNGHARATVDMPRSSLWTTVWGPVVAPLTALTIVVFAMTWARSRRRR